VGCLKGSVVVVVVVVSPAPRDGGAGAWFFAIEIILYRGVCDVSKQPCVGEKNFSPLNGGQLPGNANYYPLPSDGGEGDNGRRPDNPPRRTPAGRTTGPSGSGPDNGFREISP